MPALEVRFVVLSPSAQDRVVALRVPILVGRGDDAKFRVRKDSVSRRHCEFFAKDDVLHVRDLGSTNGTLLGKEQIPASVATVVPPGTVVNVGGVTFRVDYESTAVQPAARPDGHETRPLDDDPGAEGDAPPEAVEVEAAEEPELPAAPEPADEAAGDKGFPWQPKGDAEPPPDDENLNDFFKSLS